MLQQHQMLKQFDSQDETNTFSATFLAPLTYVFAQAWTYTRQKLHNDAKQSGLN